MAASVPSKRSLQCLVQVHLLWPQKPAPSWLARVKKDMSLQARLPGPGIHHQVPSVVRCAPAPAPFTGMCTQLEGAIWRSADPVASQGLWLHRKLSAWADNWREGHPHAMFWIAAAINGPDMDNHQAAMAGSVFSLPNLEDPTMSAWAQFFDDDSLRLGGWAADVSASPPPPAALDVVRALTIGGDLGPIFQQASRQLKARHLTCRLPQAAPEGFIRF